MTGWQQPRGQRSDTPASAEWTAGRVLTLLSHYYQPDQPSELSEAAMLDWLEILDGQSEAHIQRACIDHMRERPRTRPTPGDILKRVNAFRANEARAHHSAEVHSLPPPRERVSAEAANEILRAAGFVPRRIPQQQEAAQ